MDQSDNADASFYQSNADTAKDQKSSDNSMGWTYVADDNGNSADVTNAGGDNADGAMVAPDKSADTVDHKSTEHHEVSVAGDANVDRTAADKQGGRDITKSADSRADDDCSSNTCDTSFEMLNISSSSVEHVDTVGVDISSADAVSAADDKESVSPSADPTGYGSSISKSSYEVVNRSADEHNKSIVSGNTFTSDDTGCDNADDSDNDDICDYDDVFSDAETMLCDDAYCGVGEPTAKRPKVIWIDRYADEEASNDLFMVPNFDELMDVHTHLNRQRCDLLKTLIQRITDKGLINSTDHEGNTMLLSWVKLVILGMERASMGIPTSDPERDTSSLEERNNLAREVLHCLLRSPCDPEIPDTNENTVVSFVDKRNYFYVLNLISYPSIVAAVTNSRTMPSYGIQQLLTNECDESNDSLHLLNILINNGRCVMHNCYHDNVSSFKIIHKLLNVLDTFVFEGTPVTPEAIVVPAHAAAVAVGLYMLGCDIPSEFWLLRAAEVGAEFRLEASLQLLPLKNQVRTLINCCQIAVLRALNCRTRNLIESVELLDIKQEKARTDLKDLLSVHHSLIYYKEVLVATQRDRQGDEIYI